MADWEKISTRGNVEDRRGISSGLVGGISLTGVALFLLVNYLAGGSFEGGLQQVTQEVLNPQNQVQTVDTNEFAGEDPYEVFASAVLGSLNTTWDKQFAPTGKAYEAPRLVLFRGLTESGCGTAASQIGPHYCPTDATIYLDETFFEELSTRFGAQGGDVAQAYVIAHEVGHHVQSQRDELETASRTNEGSVRAELQADCYAGVWANSIKELGIFEPGEIKEAMDAAAAVGDDRIQERAQGYVNPESFTHGSSEERVAAFTLGYEDGTMETCVQ